MVVAFQGTFEVERSWRDGRPRSSGRGVYRRVIIKALPDAYLDSQIEYFWGTADAAFKRSRLAMVQIT